MCQTPTKGPFQVELYREDDEPDMWCVCGPETICPDTAVCHFDNEEQASIICESLNIHHETKQTPRQILESREALRELLNQACLMLRNVVREDINDIETDILIPLEEIEEKTEALTIAKEGGPK